MTPQDHYGQAFSRVNTIITDLRPMDATAMMGVLIAFADGVGLMTGMIIRDGQLRGVDGVAIQETLGDVAKVVAARVTAASEALQTFAKDLTGR